MQVFWLLVCKVGEIDEIRGQIRQRPGELAAMWYSNKDFQIPVQATNLGGAVAEKLAIRGQ